MPSTASSWDSKIIAGPCKCEKRWVDSCSFNNASVFCNISVKHCQTTILTIGVLHASVYIRSSCRYQVCRKKCSVNPFQDSSSLPEHLATESNASGMNFTPHNVPVGNCLMKGLIIDPLLTELSIRLLRSSSPIIERIPPARLTSCT